MSQEKESFGRESLVEYAQELILERKGAKELRVVRVLEDQVPSNKLRIVRVDMQDIQKPNELYRVFLDENKNEIVDLEQLSKSEGVSFFLPQININRERLRLFSGVESRTFDIEPKANIFKLDFNEVFEEIITVNIGAGGLNPQVDIYFLADTTGSIGMALGGVKTAIKSVYPPRSGWLAGLGRLKDG